MPSKKTKDEADVVLGILAQLGLPVDQYFINGSGVMALHGIDRERPIGDLDIFTTTDLWFHCYNSWPITAGINQYFESHMWTLIVPDAHDQKRRCDPAMLRGHVLGLTVDIFLNWRRRGGLGDFDPAFYLANIEMVEGIPCVPLQFIMDWKLGQGRNKDLMDVVSIRKHLGMDGTIAD